MPHHTQRDLYFAYHCLCIVILFWNPDRRRRGGHWSQFYPGKYHTHLPVKFSVGDTSVCFGNELKLNAIVSHTCLLFPGWHLAHCIKPLLWGSGQSLLLSVPTNISLLCLGFLNLLIYCVIMWLGTHEEVRGQLGWDRSLSYLHVGPGIQTQGFKWQVPWWWGPFLMEPSHCPPQSALLILWQWQQMEAAVWEVGVLWHFDQNYLWCTVYLKGTGSFIYIYIFSPWFIDVWIMDLGYISLFPLNFS